jgi:hypothetical protein
LLNRKCVDDIFQMCTLNRESILILNDFNPR